MDAPKAPGLLFFPCLATRSGEHHRIPTETFLLPGQQAFTVKPWEIANLPRASTAGKPPPPPKGNTLDDDATLQGDPCAGWEIGPCEIIRRLSPGSVKVLLAIRHDPRDGAALVVMRRIDVPDARAAEIQQHAESAWKFKHPHLSRVFRCEASDEGIFWVSERASGATLGELFEACKKLGKGVPVGLLLGAVYEAALALGELHVPSGFSHGLVSDQAIAVAFDGTARLQDAGMFQCFAGSQRRDAAPKAPATDDGRQKTWGDVLETVGPYLSPEQLLQGRMPDAKSDVYSLGAVLYEGLTGQRLPRAASFDDRVKKLANTTFVPPSNFNVSLGKELDAVLATAMSADRAKRYEDSLQFAQALKKAAASFMWRSELRADFVGNLFPTRKRREQALLEQCAPKRSLTRPELQMPVFLPPPLPPVRVAPPAAGARPPVAPKPAARPVPVRVPSRHLRPLSLGLVASALAWVAWSGVVPADYQQWNPPPPSQVVFARPPAPPVVVVPPAAPSEPMVCEAPPTVEPAAAAGPAPEAPKVAVKKLKPKKKKADDIPDAPWLQSPRRGRR